jgi:hypothetical protein
MVGHRLDLEAVGEAVGSKGFVCGWCHVDGLWFGQFLHSFNAVVIAKLISGQ